ncbi:hypothetical protein L1887_38301 [Cichorium endivia]|nr:hypothetical protein L1887_38301 [Cichorium endivia]
MLLNLNFIILTTHIRISIDPTIWSPRFYLLQILHFYAQMELFLYTESIKDRNESNPNPVQKNDSNLPQGGLNDDAYWLDLPHDGSSHDRVKKGSLKYASSYLHVKPISSGGFTDIAIWVFYPFNGKAREKLEFINLSLGKLCEHVGEWEHVRASDLQYYSGNKSVVYALLHGHASYPKPWCVLLGSGWVDIGVRDKSDNMMDTRVKVVVIMTKYMESAVVEPPWLNY